MESSRKSGFFDSVFDSPLSQEWLEGFGKAVRGLAMALCVGMQAIRFKFQRTPLRNTMSSPTQSEPIPHAANSGTIESKTTKAGRREAHNAECPESEWGWLADCHAITQDPLHLHDFQVTLLPLMGVDYKRLTFRFQGRDYRLTDVHGNVVTALLA